MAKIQDLVSTFNQLKPGLAQDYVDSATRTLKRLADKHGADLRKLGRAHGGADARDYRAYSHYIRWSSDSFVTEVYAGIQEDYLAKAAAQYADDQIAAFTKKLIKKLGDLYNVVIHDLRSSSLTFSISGEFAGHKVHVRQDRIINCSPKGNLFHQWPARISVDGKFTPESAYKKMVAAAAEEFGSAAEPDSLYLSDADAAVLECNAAHTAGTTALTHGYDFNGWMASQGLTEADLPPEDKDGDKPNAEVYVPLPETSEWGFEQQSRMYDEHQMRAYARAYHAAQVAGV
jgi:hypothetical protein